MREKKDESGMETSLSFVLLYPLSLMSHLSEFLEQHEWPSRHLIYSHSLSLPPTVVDIDFNFWEVFYRQKSYSKDKGESHFCICLLTTCKLWIHHHES